MRYSSQDLIPQIGGMLSKNAEAVIYWGSYLGRDVVLKTRIPKRYRHPNLDNALRQSRISREVKVLIQAKKGGVNVPFVYFLDLEASTIILQKIKGHLLKEIVDAGKFHRILRDLGLQVGRLHNLNIIHGDLTTSNAIVQEETNQVFLIDFGLAQFSNHVEEKAVDINVFLRTLQSTHPQVWTEAWDEFLGGYIEVAENGHGIIKRMRKIDERVRYKSH